MAQARGAQVMRSTLELTKDKLNGMLPVAEDWHAKVCLMEVSSIMYTVLLNYWLFRLEQSL